MINTQHLSTRTDEARLEGLILAGLTPQQAQEMRNQLDSDTLEFEELTKTPNGRLALQRSSWIDVWI
ncbi:MAG: hypothetical protein KME06_06025 [Kastovskya adunca ATA6-11-RM4]|jgi:hypothetical protein|nr:hypothetical protein [Kastovskya adunca ATA6-11-RM4]